MNEIARKSRKRAPWWMYALAVAFLSCAAMQYYAFYIMPENPGIEIRPVTDKGGLAIGVVITAVMPDSAAERAGLQVGDLVLISDSDGFISTLPTLNVLYLESDHTYRMEIKRKQENKAVFLTLNRGGLGSWITGLNKHYWVIILMSPLYLILAAIVAFSRPYVREARWGALFLATSAISTIYSICPVGLYSTAMRFPYMIAWLTLFFASACRTLNISVQITFFAVFPRVLFQRFWMWILVWVPALGLTQYLSAAIRSDLPRLYSFQQPGLPFFTAQILTFVYWCASVAVLLSNYIRLRDLNERRRLRVMAVGLAVSIIAALPFAANVLLARWSLIRQLFQVMPENLWLVLASFLLAGPIAISYAILRHRLFDIRVMIRLGLQYAVARGALLSLVPVLAVILAGDLFFHQDQPLRQIMGQRGLLYAVLAGGGFLLHIRRQVWLDAIDRRFFRERYDAQLVLRAVVEEIREARIFEKVAPHVVAQVEAALHPELVALLVRKPGEAKYRVLAAQEQAPPPIPAGSKLMALMRVLGKPVEISQSQTGWLRNQLPQQESEFLRQARLEWLFPICLVEGQTEALLAMGPKRSEEPYSREDRDLLQGITSSLALLLEQSPSLASVREGFEECPTCGTCYNTGSGSCKKEGAKLISLPFPRLLANRYRFEQRLGEGGMGTVYQAFDTELLRQVAVKLIRSDLTASEQAAVRFRQEARAAASFTHPNVVTVHDFGVAEGQRAYLVMELLRGLTLRQELNKNGRLSAARASEVLSGVCAAVDAAHRQKLLHRDLKPENIFLVRAGSVETAKILDFGVVKPIASADTTLTVGQTSPGVLVGTLKYMSPEQLRGDEPSESWDLWALAIVAYEMLAGVHPFAGSTVFDVRDAVLAGRATPLRAHLPEAPPSWQHFFNRALSARTELRPSSALRLLSDFNQSIRQIERNAAN